MAVEARRIAKTAEISLLAFPPSRAFSRRAARRAKRIARSYMLGPNATPITRAESAARSETGAAASAAKGVLAPRRSPARE